MEKNRGVIGIITPASSLDEAQKIREGLSYLTGLGYDVRMGDFVFGSRNHFSGTPQERARDIMNFFSDSEVKAIVCSCGGSGSAMVLPYLDYEIIRSHPKPVIGFSDIIALQNAIYARANVSSLAGIMLKFDFYDTRIDSKTKTSFEELLKGKLSPCRSGDILNFGKASGVMLGGNLCTFMSLAGTPYFPSLKNTVLVLEDVDEKSYSIERMLTHLEQLPDFNEVSGIIFGQFTNCGLNHPEDRDIEGVIDEFAARHRKITMIKHFPHGHIKSRICLPIGKKVLLNATENLPILEMTD